MRKGIRGRPLRNGSVEFMRFRVRELRSEKWKMLRGCTRGPEQRKFIMLLPQSPLGEAV